MRKRLLVAAGTMAGLVGVVLVVVAMLMPRPGVTKADFERIQIGMTEAEVESIFGGKGQPGFGHQSPWKYWTADNGSFAALIIDEDRVDLKLWFKSNETFSDKIRRWLRLPPPTPPVGTLQGAAW